MHSASCDVRAWSIHVDSGCESTEIGALEGNTYNIRYTYPKRGCITPGLHGDNGVSGIRISGISCKVKFMQGNTEVCTLESGDYWVNGPANFGGCPNDAINRFEVLRGSQGRSTSKDISHHLDYGDYVVSVNVKIFLS